MKKAAAFFAMVLLFVCLFSACGTGDKELIGRWETDDEGLIGGFVFEADGAGQIFQGDEFRDLTWSASRGKLTVKVSGVTMITDAEYIVEGEELYITYNGSTVVFTKK